MLAAAAADAPGTAPRHAARGTPLPSRDEHVDRGDLRPGGWLHRRLQAPLGGPVCRWELTPSPKRIANIPRPIKQATRPGDARDYRTIATPVTGRPFDFAGRRPRIGTPPDQRVRGPFRTWRYPVDLAALKQKLGRIGQEQVLRFESQLSAAEKHRLAAQLAALDLDDIAELVETQVKRKASFELPKKIEPVRAYPRVPGPEQRDLYARAEQRGHEMLRQGMVGAFLVAGGQGTRLGYDGPKGEFPVTPVKNKPLFQVFAEQLLAHSRDAGRSIPWYIMTSETNDAPTRAFFAKHNFFGYPKQEVYFFQQGLMPAFDMNGKILLDSEDSLALSPDGHGGSLRALAKSGALADMKRRGVEHLSYFQVDNPLVHTIDPRFLGLHDLTGSEMSSKTVAKAGPLEKVGNFCIGDGKVQVIEYSDLPEELARKTEGGSLAFNAGSIAIHALRVSFIE